MAATFDDGFRRPYDRLVRDAPGDDVYPQAAFRTEWGPIFHRGRLDGSARVLVLGQDPATHETICRRILVGEAGQRLQGLLAKLGITRSYILINTFLYSVYGQGGGTKHVNDDGIVAYRNVIHPTYPESASATGTITKAAAMARLTASWNDALSALHGNVRPDEVVALVPYGAAIAKTDLAPIPPIDLPAGLPPWMCALDAWAARTGVDAQIKRATITVTVPRSSRTWPVLPVKKAAAKKAPARPG